MEKTKELIEKAEQQVREFVEKYNGCPKDLAEKLYQNEDITGVNLDYSCELIDVDYKDITITMLLNKEENKYYVEKRPFINIWNETGDDYVTHDFNL